MSFQIPNPLFFNRAQRLYIYRDILFMWIFLFKKQTFSVILINKNRKPQKYLVRLSVYRASPASPPVMTSLSERELGK